METAPVNNRANSINTPYLAKSLHCEDSGYGKKPSTILNPSSGNTGIKLKKHNTKL